MPRAVGLVYVKRLGTSMLAVAVAVDAVELAGVGGGVVAGEGSSRADTNRATCDLRRIVALWMRRTGDARACDRGLISGR